VTTALTILTALGWLIRDTFRQSLASGVFWLMLALSAVFIAVCLSVGIQGDVPIVSDDPAVHPMFLGSTEVAAAHAAVADLVPHGMSQSLGIWQVPTVWYSTPYRQVEVAQRQNFTVITGRMTVMFGLVPWNITRDRLQAVRELQQYLGGWVGGSIGLLLALLFTAGFLPTFLEPSAVSVLLAKPAPRWSLLLGKYLGVLTFVTFQAVVFVGGTWLALGARTDVWDFAYFLALPLFLLSFAIFFGFSVLLAVLTRSTVASAFGSILFWLVCWGMNYGRHVSRTALDVPSLGYAADLGYWILPKPTDLHLLLAKSLGATDLVSSQINLQQLTQIGAWSPTLSVASSVLAAVVLLLLAEYEFVHTDY
jgi:ABC-2 family transporter protein